MPEADAAGTTHCGAGCTLGDLVGEFVLVAFPCAAVLFGPVGSSTTTSSLPGYSTSFSPIFGIAFQYFSIAPMRQLSLGQGIWASVKADTVSIAAWQIGMYGIMGIGQFLVLPTLLPAALTRSASSSGS